MRRQPYKLHELASLLLAGVFVAGGVFALLTAPGQFTSPDRQRLRQELQENADLLDRQGASDFPAALSQPVIPSEPSAGSAPPEQHSQEDTYLTFTAIGDSVLLGAVPEMQRLFPDTVIDAKESRQVWDAFSVVQDLDAKGKLRDIVVVALGNNGSFDKSSGQKLIDYLGPDRAIYWIEPFGQYLTWQESTTRILNELARENENVTILNWPETASQHPGWFYDDRMHLNAKGQAGYAAFLLEQLEASIPNDVQSKDSFLYGTAGG